MWPNNTIHIVVPGPPQAQKRHRHTARGKFVRVYDPSSADKADFLACCLQKCPPEPLEGPLMIELHFGMPRPKSHYTKKGLRQTAPIFHTAKPDSDNLVKLIFDALNGRFWRDDSQIVKLFVTKLYSSQPQTEILLTPITL